MTQKYFRPTHETVSFNPNGSSTNNHSSLEKAVEYAKSIAGNYGYNTTKVDVNELQQFPLPSVNVDSFVGVRYQ